MWICLLWAVPTVAVGQTPGATKGAPKAAVPKAAADTQNKQDKPEPQTRAAAPQTPRRNKAPRRSAVAAKPGPVSARLGASGRSSEAVVGPGAPGSTEIRLKRGWVEVEQQLDLRDVDKRALAVRQEAERGRDDFGPGLAEDGSVQFEYGAGVPKLFCRPLFSCDIALRSDEQVVQIDLGTGRGGPWMAKLVVGVPGLSTRRPHVTVRPKKTRVKTTLAIFTTLRAYHFDLIPSEEPMRFVSFSYPHEEAQEALQLHAMHGGSGVGEGAEHGGPFSPRPWEWNDDYEWECESRWRVCRRIRSWMAPESVMDDGNVTQITLPEEVLSRDRPVLHLISPTGERLQVNYTVHGRTYVVPQVFDEASLMLRYGKRRRHRLEYRIRRIRGQ